MASRKSLETFIAWRRGPGGRQVKIMPRSSSVAKTLWAAEGAEGAGLGLGLSTMRLVTGWGSSVDRRLETAL